MNKEQILELFYQNSSLLSTPRLLSIFIVGVIIGAVIFFTYRLTYTGTAYNSRFNISNMAILLITIVIMLMISSNIVISLGMVGALSIVRFRTAIKDPRDTVFIFWSIVEGLCIGSLNNKLAIISTLVIAAFLIAATWILPGPGKYLVILRTENVILTEADLRGLLSEDIRACKLRNLHRNGTVIEMIYEVRLKKGKDAAALKQLVDHKDIAYMNWLTESGDTVG